MRFFVILLVLFLQFHFLLPINTSSTDMQEHGNIEPNGTSSEHRHGQITVIRRLRGFLGGGGGSRGYTGGVGGGSGRGAGTGKGGSSRARGGMLPVIGAGGAAAAGASTTHQHHHSGSTCATAPIWMTLLSLISGLGLYIIRV